MRRRLGFATQLMQRTARAFLDDDCPQLAAAIAYHALFSLFPFALLLGGVFSLVVNVTGTRADVVDLIVRQLPLSADGSEQLRTLLESATGSLSTLGMLGLLGVVYGASGMMASIRVALNRAWDVDDARPFLRGKLVDVALVGGVASLALLSLAFSLGAEAAAAAARALGGNTGADWAGWAAGAALPLVLGFVASLLLYRLVPACHVRLRDAALGAAVASAAVSLSQSLLALYIRHVSDYNAIYGAIGVAMAFMLFVYLSGLILLAGAELASELPRARALYDADDRPAGRPLTGQVRAFVSSLWKRDAKLPQSSGAGTHAPRRSPQGS